MLSWTSDLDRTIEVLPVAKLWLPRRCGLCARRVRLPNDFATASCRSLSSSRHPREWPVYRPPLVLHRQRYALQLYSSPLSSLSLSPCLPISAAFSAVGPSRARAARTRRKMKYVDSFQSSILPPNSPDPTISRIQFNTSFGNGVTIGRNVTNRRQQTPAAKKAAPKKSNRASRVIDDSDDDEVVDVKYESRVHPLGTRSLCSTDPNRPRQRNPHPRR